MNTDKFKAEDSQAVSRTVTVNHQVMLLVMASNMILVGMPLGDRAMKNCLPNNLVIWQQ
jgi:hypothetical protein